MASAKQQRINRMVDILGQSASWVPASMLANMLGASERSVRNYVTEVNAGGDIAIESSKEGYRIATTREGGLTFPTAQNAQTTSGGTESGAQTTEIGIDSRCNYVISHLVNAHGPLSVFDLADELCISESTLSSAVMPQVRELARRFNLTVETHDFQMGLTGLERDKRKLLGHIATHNSYGYFSSTQTLEEMFPGFDVQ